MELLPLSHSRIEHRFPPLNPHIPAVLHPDLLFSRRLSHVVAIERDFSNFLLLNGTLEDVQSRDIQHRFFLPSRLFSFGIFFFFSPVTGWNTLSSMVLSLALDWILRIPLDGPNLVAFFDRGHGFANVASCCGTCSPTVFVTKIAQIGDEWNTENY